MTLCHQPCNLKIMNKHQQTLPNIFPLPSFPETRIANKILGQDYVTNCQDCGYDVWGKIGKIAYYCSFCEIEIHTDPPRGCIFCGMDISPRKDFELTREFCIVNHK